LVCDNLQDELIDCRNDSACNDMFDTLSICEFRPKIELFCVANECVKKRLSFISPYLCESSFSTVMQMKTKGRNRVNAESVLRCALSSSSPRIRKLVQQQYSHEIAHRNKSILLINVCLCGLSI